MRTVPKNCWHCNFYDEDKSRCDKHKKFVSNVDTCGDWLLKFALMVVKDLELVEWP